MLDRARDRHRRAGDRALLIVVILALVVSLVAQRYLPGVSLPWTGEVARLSMVWLTFVMSGYLASRDRHIAIHVVDYVLKGRALATVKLVANLIVFVTCLALVYATIQLLADDVGQVTPAAEIPLLLVNFIRSSASVSPRCERRSPSRSSTFQRSRRRPTGGAA